MKKIQMFSLAITLLASIFGFQSCVKETAETADGSVDYIQKFYGVNKDYEFILPHPSNPRFSKKLIMHWDEKGIANYKAIDIPRDSANEHNARVFLPASEFDVKSATISPTNDAVNTITLIYVNGTLEPQLLCNGGCCNGYYTCSSGCSGPHAYYYSNGTFGWWYCVSPPQVNYTCTPTYHPCGGGGGSLELPTITFQTY